MKKLLYLLKPNEKPIVSILEEHTLFLSYHKFIDFLQISLFIILLIAGFSSFALNYAIFRILAWILILYFLYIQFKWTKKIKVYYEDKYYFDYGLLQFIIDNNLYKEEANGNLTSAIMSYSKTPEDLIIYAFMVGNKFDTKMQNMEVELQGLIKLPLIEKIIKHDVVEYHFKLAKPKRLYIDNSRKTTLNETNIINLGYNFKYDSAKCPHIESSTLSWTIAM
ncbi:hypothetical protein [Macrococcus carouselicus]|uniref:Uncharacterized protein n=1 Tax=Macrococcus carouselicus TaxID=69969 RepID=A0A9Q8FQF2_9STAP|nr:hypothetical protein [Macrococcus carouselicus]TDM02387.1 hypothetical protein ERX40_07475 [Macrococcus carouselicus]